MFQNPSAANNAVLEGVAGNNPTTQQQNINYNGMQQQQQQQQTRPPPPQQQQQQPQQQQQQSQPAINANRAMRKKPYIKITEQPAGKALRFRYECEGRSAGSIPGVNSTTENKTYPSIEIVGYKGRAVVVVSCVTKDPPYRPHPHNLVGKEGCKKGVCTMEVNSETMRVVFSNLGIQCVKKKDIEAALKSREEIRVDPFKTGFSHRFQPSSIDLNSVRLCFQVFMESTDKGRFTQALTPVVSDPIFDKKAMSDLVICRLCSCSASVLGSSQIILLCEKVAKEDISVRFYEEKNGQVIWEALGEFQHTDVHKQTAITFKTPRYRTLDITQPAKVWIQLRRPSDGVTSEPLPFEYVPLDSDPSNLKRKRQKTGGDPMHLLLQQQQQKQHQMKTDHPDGRQPNNMPDWHMANIRPIKVEPRESSPQPFHMYRVPPELTPSPQPMSPPSNYAQNGVPSPFNLSAVLAGNSPGSSSGSLAAQHNAQILSPNAAAGGGGGAGGGAGGHQYNGAVDGLVQNHPAAMDISYNAYSQQQQQHHQQQHPQHQHAQQQQHSPHHPHTVHHHQQHQQQQQQQHQPQHQQQQQHQQLPPPQQQQQQQQFEGHLFGGTTAGTWEEKFIAAATVAVAAAANHNSTNLFPLHSLLAPNNGAPSHQQQQQQQQQQHWNLPPNHAQQQGHMIQQQQQHQQQQQQQAQQHPNNNFNQAQNPMENNNAGAVNVEATKNNNNNNNNENNNAEQGPTLSNLLSFDSEQLVRINSEDQQMIRLNSEDLQISNLSIST